MSLINETYNRAALITKSDTVNIDNWEKMLGIWVGGAGIVKAMFADESTAEFTCVAGTLLPINCKRVQSATTTATLMYAMFQV